MGYRVDQLSQRRAFWLAWLFLVAVVSVTLFMQGRTLARLERDEDAIVQAVNEQTVTTTRNAETLCGVLVSITPKEDDALIVSAFADLGYRCTIPSEGG